MPFKFALAAPFLALCSAAAGQLSQPQLNSWRQPSFGYPETTDGNVGTFKSVDLSRARFSLLFNNYDNYAGLYIQSSSANFITDYNVDAVIGNTDPVVGRVCGATSNFTLITFTDPATGNPWIRTATMFVNVINTLGSNSNAIVNEIYPIYQGDSIFDPGNTVPCPPDGPSPPATTTTTAIPSATTARPTGTATQPPASLTVPGHPEATLARWVAGTTSGGFTLSPILIGTADYIDDYDPSTANTPSSSFSFLFNTAQRYRGLYVQAPAGSTAGIPALHVTTYDNSIQTSWTVGTLAADPTAEFAVIRFVDHTGVEATVSLDELFFAFDGPSAPIAEIYPIYEGDAIVNV